jgi:negative regulator of flagellin synthesis FlgM
MQIHGPTQVHGAQPIGSPHRGAAAPAAQPNDTYNTVDQLDISREADVASRLQDVPEIRTDRVASIRAQIEAGVYETDEKINLAVERLLDEIG